jgi:hypothetical protein
VKSLEKLSTLLLSVFILSFFAEILDCQIANVNHISLSGVRNAGVLLLWDCRCQYSLHRDGRLRFSLSRRRTLLLMVLLIIFESCDMNVFLVLKLKGILLHPALKFIDVHGSIWWWLSGGTWSKS